MAKEASVAGGDVKQDDTEKQPEPDADEGSGRPKRAVRKSVRISEG